ncbi:MAG: hypothetical protein UY20_C0003G0009 [Candidatus Yanofskybacteria bacterium GW2011_GWA1_48_10]|uniref:Sortase family protein n=2 Tax=Candidatus Yanofskyibacteriota TaxID=1752733 RepID=A0A0G1X6E0_9BACT|nr:MAG: hypothetical protein UY20_C0003G0009 [Candidatus Yanofskybacteria bacterium GW2011_GWA1_48_10]OGN06732.1 MAG: hypothetical protein A2669_00155 [Candidatus Yanofskybacteria bacterium RIFCSPHIGHO2_01_FULL_48_25b]
MDSFLSPLSSSKIPNPPKKTSKKAVLGVFAVAFILLFIILNLPSLVKSLAYPFKHSADSDNELLTKQYRDLYGYEKHPELISAVQAVAYTPRATEFPISVPAPASPDSFRAEWQAELSVPKIGIKAPVLQVKSTNDSEIFAALKNGVVLFPGSVNPGQPGAAVIIGHSSSDLPWTKYSAVFSLLDKLAVNDLVYITVNGKQYTYRVREFKKGTARQIAESGLTGDLILSTCWPVGSDQNRIAVSATLVQ